MKFQPKSEYGKKLLDPRWQKKRLEVFDRDNFHCQYCGSDEETLHVHHITYSYGADPWDYPDYNLITLCHECHQRETDYSKDTKKLVVQEIVSCGFSVDHYMDIAAGFSFYKKDDSRLHWNATARVIRFLLENPTEAKQIYFDKIIRSKK